MSPSWQIHDQANVDGLHTGTDPLHLGTFGAKLPTVRGTCRPVSRPLKGGMDDFKIWRPLRRRYLQQLPELKTGELLLHTTLIIARGNC